MSCSLLFYPLSFGFLICGSLCFSLFLGLLGLLGLLSLYFRVFSFIPVFKYLTQLQHGLTRELLCSTYIAIIFFISEFLATWNCGLDFINRLLGAGFLLTAALLYWD